MIYHLKYRSNITFVFRRKRTYTNITPVGKKKTKNIARVGSLYCKMKNRDDRENNENIENLFV